MQGYIMNSEFLEVGLKIQLCAQNAHSGVIKEGVIVQRKKGKLLSYKF